MSEKEKVIIGLLTIILVFGGILTLRSKIRYGSPVAFLNDISLLKQKSKSEKTLPSNYMNASVNSEAINLRPAPNSNNTPIKVLYEGAEVKVFSVDDQGWAKVIDDTGVEGYLFNEYLRY